MRNLLLLFTCLLASCTHYSPEIESVLKQAGNNRKELEQVLKHYSQRPEDSLKLRAAEFLIVNMPGKYSSYYDAPWEDVGTVHLRWSSSSDKQLVLDTYKLGELVKKEDIEYITSEYLINNIELAVKMWREQPWGKDIPFNIFCEEVLPYRVSTEPLENWREKALASFADLNKSFKKDSSITVTEACSKVNALLPQFRIDKDFPSMNYSQLMATTRAPCDGMAALAVFAMRAMGIPVSIDYTPLWPDRNYGHTWNSVYDGSGAHISFMGTETQPGQPHQGINFPVSKIYRYTFTRQNNIKTELSNIPHLLQYPCMRDATSDYHMCADVMTPLLNQPINETGYAYLATIYEMEWIPVGWGTVEQNSLSFPSVGKKALYLPVFYSNQIQTPAYYPFWLDEDGCCSFFQPGSMQPVQLKGITPDDHRWIDRLVDGVVEGANCDDFSDAKKLHIIRKIEGPWFHTASIKNSPKFRYIRYVSPKLANCNIAEIELIDEAGENLQGSAIGTTGSWENSPMTHDKAFDGDPTTFFDAKNDNSWTGLDLGEPKTIGQIRYMPRTDGNDIYIGHTYELFYWDGLKWQTLGVQTAKYPTLYYQVPSNALFVIKNITKNNIYRRPFIIENGVQKWL